MQGFQTSIRIHIAVSGVLKHTSFIFHGRKRQSVDKKNRFSVVPGVEKIRKWGFMEGCVCDKAAKEAPKKEGENVRLHWEEGCVCDKAAKEASRQECQPKWLNTKFPENSYLS